MVDMSQLPDLSVAAQAPRSEPTGTDGRDLPTTRLDRRAFVVGAAALLATASCAGSDTDGSTSEPDPNPTAGPAPTAAASESEQVDAPADDVDAAAGGTDTNADTNPDPATDTNAGAQDAASPPSPFDDATVALTPALFDAVPMCVLVPTSTAGPYPTRDQLERQDITEGYPGHPLRLGIRVTDTSCAPVPDADVEIWHTDATGDYSSYDDGGSGKDEGEESTFCRGFQTSDADGIVEFLTIYPGWYEGRAVHIHARVRVGGELVTTTQLYFDEAYSEAVFESGVYAEFGPPDTSWADDRIIDDPTTDGSGITLRAAPTDQGDGTLGLVNLGIDL